MTALSARSADKVFQSTSLPAKHGVATPLSVLEFKATEYGRAKKVVATEEVKAAIAKIGINKCARESGFDRKNFIRKLVRGLPVKRNSYEEFHRWLLLHKSARAHKQ